MPKRQAAEKNEIFGIFRVVYSRTGTDPGWVRGAGLFPLAVAPGDVQERDMWLLCGGMKRSGSTLQYQLAAALVESLGVGGRFPAQALDSEEIPEHEPLGWEWTVFKTHVCGPRAASLLASGRARALYVFRDLRDVVVSLMAMKGHTFEKTMARRDLPKAVEQYARWTSCPNVLVSRYEDIIRDLRKEVERIAEHLGLAVSPAAAAGIAEAYSVVRQRERIAEARSKGLMEEHDGRAILRNERLHENHIFTGGAGGWRNVLSPSQAAEVQSRYGDWLRARGYL